jgi:hypothetical protein
MRQQRGGGGEQDNDDGGQNDKQMTAQTTPWTNPMTLTTTRTPTTAVSDCSWGVYRVQECSNDRAKRQEGTPPLSLQMRAWGGVVMFLVTTGPPCSKHERGAFLLCI